MQDTINYKQTVEELSRQNHEPDWLTKSRLESLEKFNNSPLPEFKYGKGIILNPSNLDFNINPKESNTTISEKDIELLDIKDAVNKHEILLKENLFKLIQIDDKLTSLHAALTNIQLIIIKDNISLKEPLQINTLFEENSFTHKLIIIGNNCNLSIIENLKEKNKSKCMISNVVEIFVGQNSKVNFYSSQNLSSEVFYHNINIGKVAKDSTLNWLVCQLGSLFSKSNTSTILEGEGSESNNLGLFFGRDEQQFDIYSSAIHAGPHTTSDMLTKGVVKDKSRSIYRGLVEVKENAANSNGYQKEDVLILDPTAEADAIPRLEIGNNNVRCTHGTTIGQIDKEKLFYLKSRGLPEEESKKMIIEGFFEPLFVKIKDTNFTQEIREIISQKI